MTDPEGAPGSAHAGSQSSRTLLIAAGILVALSLVGLALGAIVEGESPAEEAAGEEDLLEEIGGGWAGWGSLGLMAGTFFLGWARTGVPITRPVRVLKRWRADIHIWTSVVALGLALLHTVELVVLGEFTGWVSGMLATVYLGALFVTGWWRPHFMEAWGKTPWRIVHWQLAIGTLLMSLLHWMALEGSLPNL